MILLIGGTSETAGIAEKLAESNINVLVSTATDIELNVGSHPLIERRAGRLGPEELIELIRSRGIKIVVDAAHPYAVEIHGNARTAAEATGIPLFRWERPGSLPHEHGVTYADDHDRAARTAASLGKPILLTVGSRNVRPYVVEARRHSIPIFARVLNQTDSLSACIDAGLTDAEIIRGRGPFSIEENRETIQRLNVGVIVTKDSGPAGGVPEKLRAAREEGCSVVMVKRPQEHCDEIFSDVEELVKAVRRELLCWNGTS